MKRNFLKPKSLLVAGLVMISLFSCEKEAINDEAEFAIEALEETTISASESELAGLKKMGFNVDEVVVDEVDGERFFKVDGDIILSAADVNEANSKQRVEYINGVRVLTCNNARNIRLQVNFDLVPFHRLANGKVRPYGVRNRNRLINQNIVQKAVNQFNAINGSFVNIKIVTNNPNVIVRFVRPGDPFQNSLLIDGNSASQAIANVPRLNGNFGSSSNNRSLLIINPFLNVSAKVLQSTIMHELGHIIGLGHTDDFSNKTRFISGTDLPFNPEFPLDLRTDTGSVFWSNPPFNPIRFTPQDIKAINRLYGRGRNDNLCDNPGRKVGLDIPRI